MIRLGDKEIKKIYLGNTPVKAVYLGEKKIWPEEGVIISHTISVYCACSQNIGQVQIGISISPGDENIYESIQYGDIAMWEVNQEGDEFNFSIYEITGTGLVGGYIHYRYILADAGADTPWLVATFSRNNVTMTAKTFAYIPGATLEIFISGDSQVSGDPFADF